jgi:hypothetical protein
MPKIFIPLCEKYSLWAFHNGFLFGKLKVLSQSPKTDPVRSYELKYIFEIKMLKSKNFKANYTF